MRIFDIRALSCCVMLAAMSSLAAAQAPDSAPAPVPVPAAPHAPAPPVVKEGTTVKISQHV